MIKNVVSMTLIMVTVLRLGGMVPDSNIPITYVSAPLTGDLLDQASLNKSAVHAYAEQMRQIDKVMGPASYRRKGYSLAEVQSAISSGNFVPKNRPSPLSRLMSRCQKASLVDEDTGEKLTFEVEDLSSDEETGEKLIFEVEDLSSDEEEERVTQEVQQSDSNLVPPLYVFPSRVYEYAQLMHKVDEVFAPVCTRFKKRSLATSDNAPRGRKRRQRIDSIQQGSDFAQQLPLGAGENSNLVGQFEDEDILLQQGVDDLAQLQETEEESPRKVLLEMEHHFKSKDAMNPVSSPLSLIKKLAVLKSLVEKQGSRTDVQRVIKAQEEAKSRFREGRRSPSSTLAKVLFSQPQAACNQAGAMTTTTTTTTASSLTATTDRTPTELAARADQEDYGQDFSFDGCMSLLSPSDDLGWGLSPVKQTAQGSPDSARDSLWLISPEKNHKRESAVTASYLPKDNCDDDYASQGEDDFVL